jgi:NADH pyrophosphatase NudC (nudix superfamily)
MFCLKCGATMVKKEVDGEPRTACPACDYVFWNNPVPIAGTIVTQGESILLVQRQIDPPDRYALVAGYLEAHESAKEAAVREVKEETNLDVVIKSIVGVYSCRAVRLNAIFIVQHAQVIGGQLQLSSELRDAKWFTCETLPNYPAHYPIAMGFRDWFAKNGASG